MNNFTYETLSEFLKFNKNESTLFIPNEIFTDLKNNIMNGSHMAFAYTYLYFITWLYRFTKYHGLADTVDQRLIKHILGFNPDYKKLNYIIKKNGILEQMEYIKTVRDFPITWEFDEHNDIEFTVLSDFKNTDMYDYIKKDSNYKIKLPVKAFHRYSDDIQDNYYNGTFYNIENTHSIDFEIFLYCMTNENIGCTGFYIYAFLKNKNQFYTSGYDVSLDKLEKDININRRTIARYLDALKKYNMIQCIHNQEFFLVGLDKDARKPNTYITNEFYNFTNTPRKYEKIKIMKRNEYKKLLDEENLERHINQFISRTKIDEKDLPY